MKRIAVIGASGSIGRNALEVIRNYPEEFRVVFLSVHTQIDFAVEKALELQPEAVVLTGNADVLDAISVLKKNHIRVHLGEDGLLQALEQYQYDVLVNALVGGIGLLPTLTAIRLGRTVALANKESLVMAGELISREVVENNTALIPIDSEHSAIFQCLVGEDKESIKRIILTGSGGPFLNRDLGDFNSITVEEALAHPNWKMGKKITIDSATLINKGLEIIEAHWLFGLPLDQIDLVIHPQSIIHSMVEFQDGSIKAQLGWPDMKIPIQYSLTHPKRYSASSKKLDFASLKELTFMEPNLEKFPNLRLAIESIESGGVAPAVLNAANEEAVHLFLSGIIPFPSISELIEEAIDNHKAVEHPKLEQILSADRWARKFVFERVRMRKSSMG